MDNLIQEADQNLVFPLIRERVLCNTELQPVLVTNSLTVCYRLLAPLSGRLESKNIVINFTDEHEQKQFPGSD